MSNLSELPSTPTSREADLTKDVKIAFAAVVAAVIASGSYLIAFGSHRMGGPTAWASFGDYFGGLVNPVVGIVTALLVVRTLKATREEAALTRRQLEAQTDHMRLEREAGKRAELLAELQKRLDGGMDVWKHAMGERLAGTYRSSRGGTLRYDATFRTVGKALNCPPLLNEVADIMVGPEADIARESWGHDFGSAAEIMLELCFYCAEYQDVAGSNDLADYYRRRVALPALLLNRMELIDDVIVREMTPTPMYREYEALPICTAPQPEHSERLEG